MSDDFARMMKDSFLFGNNISFIEGLYEEYICDHSSVSKEWRDFFAQYESSNDVLNSKVVAHFVDIKPIISTNYSDKQYNVFKLLDDYRKYGIFYTSLDPLQLNKPLENNFFALDRYDLQDSLGESFFIDDSGKKYLLSDIITRMKEIYCNTIAFEYIYINTYDELRWLQSAIEKNYLDFEMSVDEHKRTLSFLLDAEQFEYYLQLNYVGQKRFSLEGLDIFIPVCDRILSNLIKYGDDEVYFGMAHRGRLNFLANINGKPLLSLFDEFTGDFDDGTFSSDVKYHKGYSTKYIIGEHSINTFTLYNPSHLESVNPVLSGVVRARRDVGIKAVGVIVHGDAAFTGLGTNQGLFNMSLTSAYHVGGTIHIILNNQIGFTTSNIHESRSSHFCTAIAKMVEAPIIHVNAEDIEKVMLAVDLACEYRNTFAKDVVVDLIGYRKYGHNEADDPSITQPVVYHKVAKQLKLSDKYVMQLKEKGIITDKELTNLTAMIRDSFTQKQHYRSNMMLHCTNDYYRVPQNSQLTSAIDLDIVKKVQNSILDIPHNFKVHKIVKKVIVDNRYKMCTGSLNIDYGMAEMLAYGSLLLNDYSIRFVGEDSCRGTFSHRHAVLYDVNTGIAHNTLTSLQKENSKFDIYNSVLNEECTVLFEYGYSIINNKNLVIWEAQFGDFVNGAQVAIDQYIVSSESKWGVKSNLVMFLPHGYDGQGPEHSSARLERFLQLSACQNIKVLIPTTAAQLFHFLRLHAFANSVKPAILFLSKKLLRYKDAASPLEHFTNGTFMKLICDANYSANRLIICAGQIYYVLQEHNSKSLAGISLLRIEQLYPFPTEEVSDVLAKYKHIKEYFWVQDEPKNQGAWSYIDTQFKELYNIDLKCISRDESASTAVGRTKVHQQEINDILQAALQ